MLKPKPLPASGRRLPDQGEASLFPALRSAADMGGGMIVGAGADKILLILDAAVASGSRRCTSRMFSAHSAGDFVQITSRRSLLCCTSHRRRGRAVKPAGALYDHSSKRNQCLAWLFGESAPIDKSSIDAAFICRIRSQESVGLLSAGWK
jgi:hypothetical protein